MSRPWRTDDLLPNVTTLRLLSVSATPAGVSVEAEGQQSSAGCPACGQLSQARHSRYWRTLKDLAVQGQMVTLRLHVSRWRCRQECCATQVFTERLPGVCEPHARRTRRFADVIQWVGYALGGRGGKRLLDRLGLTVSDDTVVRTLKRTAAAVTSHEVLRVVGIDDWAWQKGQHHYGTILVDLERRRVVDLLPTRAAASVAAWLAAHPSIHTISRDRHGPYAEGIRTGAPRAREVADRFHLVSNLRDAVQQELARLRRFLVVPHRPPSRVGVPRPVAASRLVRRTPATGVHHERCAEHERHAVQLERFHLVKRLHATGLSAAAMRATGIGRTLVFTWIGLPELPPRNRMAPRPGMPECYREYLWHCGSAGRTGAKVSNVSWRRSSRSAMLAATPAWPSSSRDGATMHRFD